MKDEDLLRHDRTFRAPPAASLAQPDRPRFTAEPSRRSRRRLRPDLSKRLLNGTIASIRRRDEWLGRSRSDPRIFVGPKLP
jgi:hypothetical protein